MAQLFTSRRVGSNPFVVRIASIDLFFSTEKVDGMFATVIIVLPSSFTGGAAHLEHSGLSTIYDCSATSLYQTTVMAWYTDVTHEIKPITSGYRLALSYNLVHTTTSLRPALSTHVGAAAQLRNALLAWKQDEGQTTPDKIVYLLGHKYSQANLRASALKGSDAHKVAVLDMFAKELGFHLGLATVVSHVTGLTDDNGSGYGSGFRYSGFSRYHEDKDIEFFGHRRRRVSIEGLVDLDGGNISDKLPFVPEEESIPEDLETTLEKGIHDEQEYQGYMGNVRFQPCFTNMFVVLTTTLGGRLTLALWVVPKSSAHFIAYLLHLQGIDAPY